MTSWLVVAAVACGGDDDATGVGGAGATTSVGGSGGSEPICGDGAIGGTEACDDGNLDDGDGCSSTCTIEDGFTCDATGCSPICGDGFVLGDETCDDGNLSDGDGCDAACTIEPGYDCIGEPSTCAPVCGDGVVLGDEACDDGNLDDGDGCSAACEVEAGFACDDAMPSVCDGICGDGFILGTEACDDGNLDDGDGCSATCEVETGWSCAEEPSLCSPDCGDGLVNGMETCDDGNLDDGDGCSASCQQETGYECTGEPSACAVVCGDGLIVGSETCDDGNAMSGDGCSDSCAIESGFVCLSEPSVCAPQGYGDTCAQPAEVTVGSNTVVWDGTGQDYITTTPACSSLASYNPDGPDVVMEFTASVTGEASVSVAKPNSTRWHMIASGGACGDLTSQSMCVSEFTGTTLDGAFPVLQGNTYYIYIVDSTSGANPLDNPLVVNISETPDVCGDGIITGFEGCDDGGLADGDGCSSTCQIEPGYGCTGQPSSCALVVGDTCSTAIALSSGTQSVSWTAFGQEYITSAPSCSTTAPTGPDLVMSYTATVTGDLDVSIAKPTNNRWHMLVSDGACGTIDPELACLSEYGPAELAGTIAVTQGTTYYFYLVDSTSGTAPLDNPLQVTVTENAEICGDGIITGNEQCDDGDLDDGDGCSSTCDVEPGYGCSGEPSICALVNGDNCASTIQLANGPNTINWVAFSQDYITSSPSCSSTSPDGPDLVMEFTASVTGELQFSIDKPASQRWHLLVSDGACGTIDPELLCLSEFTLTELAGTIPVTQGTTYYFYLVDSTSGTAPLDNPLTVNVAEYAEVCGDGVAIGSEACDDGNLVDGDGCSSTCTVEAGYGDTCAFPVTLSTGVQYVGWDATGQDYITSAPSCGLSYAPDGPDLVMAFTASVTGQVQYAIDKPSSQRWHLIVADGACGTTSPEVLCQSEFTLAQLAGQFEVTQGTTYYFYLVDSTSGAAPLDNPLKIEINEIEATCAPGTGGMVGTNVTAIPTGWPSFTEYYVEVDDDPNGWVYVGGTTVLRRVPKVGGTFEEVHTLAGLGSTNLGYEMHIDGLDVFTVESKTSGTSGHLFRISPDGGATWAIDDFANFSTTPADDFRGMTRHGSQLFMLTHEGTSSVATQVYSLPAGGTPPVMPTLELEFSGELNCTGLAADNFYYYVACGTNNRLVRVDRTTGAVTLLADFASISTVKAAVHASDVDSDGVADFLYFQGATREVHFVCDPTSANPYSGTLATFGTTTSSSNYGLAFDPLDNTLYAYDDSSQSIVVIK